MWLRSIYLSSAFAILLWIFPWVIGQMSYHFHQRHWKRAVGWFLAVLLIPSLILAWIFAHALENVLYTPHTTLLIVSIIVMIVQAVHWRLMWKDYRDSNIIHKMRTVALYAYLVSSLLGLLGIGSLIKEFTYKYKENQVAAEQADRVTEILASTGYIPYPGALYPLGKIPVIGQLEPENDDENRGTLTIQFRTDDPEDDVIDFYNATARANGNWAVHGITHDGTSRCLVVLGENHTAMEFINWREEFWIVVVHYGFTGGLDHLSNLEYIFEPPPEFTSELGGVGGVDG